MPPVRPHLSITLPRNFTFHYTDGEVPKTPEPEARSDMAQPPNPPRPIFRVRRRRPTARAVANPIHAQSLSLSLADVPIPTIEPLEPSPINTIPAPYQFSAGPIDSYLAPGRAFPHFISPPRTPVSQISAAPPAEAPGARHGWEHIIENLNRGQSMSRPPSVCSGLSDSSVETRASSRSRHSFGGSCTSPESDAADPFIFPKPTPAMLKPTALLSSPLDTSKPPPMKRIKVRKESSWSDELDHHLWVTYMKYLQDPTVTPFKMLPGTVPPLGVCHRVVREAKRTWRGARPPPFNLRTPTATGGLTVPRAGSPDTIKPTSGCVTPTLGDSRRFFSRWPRSDSSTRRRLRELCKRTPSLSAHYQRLLHTRSPSPFLSSHPNSEREAEESGALAPAPATTLAVPTIAAPVTYPKKYKPEHSSFSTRDMNISLTASTSATMQAGNPLAQLAAGGATPKPREEARFKQTLPPPPPAPPTRASNHAKSQSLHIGRSSRRLAAAYGLKTDFSSPYSPRVSSPRLAPPLELHSPMPLSRASFKRRAQHHLDFEGSVTPEARDSFLQELFGAPADTSHRRVRSRGFSLGDMTEGARQLSSLFTPPPTFDQSACPPSASAPQTSTMLPPAVADQTRRLGSPFGGSSTNVHFSNTFPRNFTPHAFEFPTSFEERLQEGGETVHGSRLHG